MSGRNKNRIAGDRWREERVRLETGVNVRNRRRRKLCAGPVPEEFRYMVKHLYRRPA